jgi:hypothetical protein
MCNECRRRLLEEAHRFRVWVGARSGPFGAWVPEAGVADGDVIDAFTRFVRGCSDHPWDDEVIAEILHLVALDDEPEYLVDLLTEDPVHLLAVARGSILHPRWEARWQIADRLGDLHDDKVEAESLLIRFMQDGNEYVRRRAILALARLRSQHVEQFAEAAWRTGHQYQRMAVVSALYEIGSLKLSEFLERAKADGREYLVSCAREIEARVLADAARRGQDSLATSDSV